MYPLIEIKGVPIKLEVKVTDAKLESVRGTADLQISQSDRGVSIRSSAIRLNMDTYESKGGSSVSRIATSGQTAAYQATSTYARQGQLTLNAQLSQSVAAQIFGSGSSQSFSAGSSVQYLPSLGSGVSNDWNVGEMEIHYEMDKLNFDWRMNQPQFEFTPGDITISVTQQPDVEIKYVGGPLYVPRSSDPNYEGDA